MRTRRTWILGLTWLALVGCTQRDGPTPSDTQGSAPAASLGAPAPIAVEGCVLAAGPPPERLQLRIDVGRSVASGLMVHFARRILEPQTTEPANAPVEMRFSWGDREQIELVKASEYGPTAPFKQVLDHCFRLQEVDDDGVVVEVALAESARTELPTCKPTPDTPGSPPLFDSYHEAQEGVLFRATLRYDEGAHDWVVFPQPHILRHHATRTDWTNLTALGRAGLGFARGSDVQVTFRFVSLEVRNIPDRHQWRSRHEATIESACVVKP